MRFLSRKYRRCAKSRSRLCPRTFANEPRKKVGNRLASIRFQQELVVQLQPQQITKKTFLTVIIARKANSPRLSIIEKHKLRILLSVPLLPLAGQAIPRPPFHPWAE